jgi:hypothetical protein
MASPGPALTSIPRAAEPGGLARPAAPATISLAPSQGWPNTTVVVSGNNYRLMANITITFDSKVVATTPSPCQTKGQSHGSVGWFTCLFQAPVGLQGANPVNATDGTNTASAPFDENLMGLSSPSVDVGQNLSVLGYGYGDSLMITTFTLGTFSLDCTLASVGTCSGGVVTTSPSGTFNATVVVPGVPSAGLYNIRAVDSHGLARNQTVQVDLDPVVGNITASPPAVDRGEIVVLSATVAQGSGGYAFAWSGLPGCSGLVDPLDCRPTVVGPAAIGLAVTDSNGVRVAAPTLELSVSPAPDVANPTASRSTLDVGQTVVFSTSASSGTGVYRSYNWSGLPEGCEGNASVVSCVPSAPGLASVQVEAIDSNGGLSPPSAPISVTVYPDPTVAVPFANRTALDTGQRVGFLASASGGTDQFQYAWSGLPGSCTESGPAASCVAGAAGTFAVSVRSTDSDGLNATSPSVNITVVGLPVVGLSAMPRPAVDQGQRLTLQASASGGSGGYRFAWIGLPSACSAAGATATCPGLAPGHYEVTARVIDANGGSSESVPLSLAVAPPMAATVAVATANPSPGAPVTFQPTVTGGTPSFTYTWQFGDGASGAGSPSQHTYSAAGTYTVSLLVNDSSGESVRATAQVSVASPSSGSTAALGGADLALAGGAIVVAAAVLLAVLWVRRRRPGASRAAPPPPPEEEPPTPASDEPTA